MQRLQSTPSSHAQLIGKKLHAASCGQVLSEWIKGVQLVLIFRFCSPATSQWILPQERRHVPTPSQTARLFPVVHDSYVTVARTLLRSNHWRWQAHDTAVTTSSCVSSSCEDSCVRCTDQCSAVAQPLRSHTSDDSCLCSDRLAAVLSTCRERSAEIDWTESNDDKLTRV